MRLVPKFSYFLVVLVLPSSLVFASASSSTDETEGTARVQLIDDALSLKNVWPNRVLLKYTQAAFAFSDIPQAYNEKGIRDEWPNPLRVVAEAEVDFPAGEHRALLRSRRAARLWIDGELVAENPFPPLISDGHDPVARPFLPLGEGVRFPAMGDQETLETFRTDGGKHRLKLEFFVGGFANKKPMRPETGETLVAVSLEGQDGFVIPSPSRAFPLTDDGWERLQAEQLAELDAFDRRRRRNLRSNEDPYWERRHEWARESVEGRSKDSEASLDSSIDILIEKRLAQANEAVDQSEEARYFLQTIRPILEDNCWTCHGQKAKGDLRLDSLAAAQAGGESEFPALIPGDAKDSYMLEMITDEDPEYRMPPKGEALTEKAVEALTAWIDDGATWPETTLTRPVHLTKKTEDWQFLRRVFLDTVGVPPAEAEMRAFLADEDPDKRSQMIEQLLQDPRWADHWVSYWQDVLAENPTIVNPTLNNTGPFRWWIHEALQDNLPMDRFVTELVLMEGSLLGGGPAGFEMASQNDVPMAAKANILTNAFQAVEMKCSRCHDAPFHDNKQEDLFGLAAMLAQKPLTVPASSSVPMDALHKGGRKPLIEVTLPPGSEVQPHWPFATQLPDEERANWLKEPENTREQFAFFLSNPANDRFAKVMANRLWQRLFGRGLVEPVDDWENAAPLHPDLLQYLADKLALSGYDLKALTKLVLNSDAYQRKTTEENAAMQFFAAPGPRQLSAEQIVDSLFATTGKEMDTETLTVDIGGGRPWSNAISLGQPERAWMFGGLANNRDRPSLILPRAQAVVDVMTAFGWRTSRQEPISYRQRPLSPLQPAILNNGTMTTWLTRLSDDHPFTELAIKTDSPADLVETAYVRVLSRYPSSEELKVATSFLQPGFEERIILEDETENSVGPTEPALFVTWANHLHPDANGVALAAAAYAKKGAPPTARLNSDWRKRMEDFLWSLINLPEFVYYP